jgi:2-methylisocitrate lyase-like PEP mutase family enzyme
MGFPDRERVDRPGMLEAAGSMVSAVSLPVTADMEVASGKQPRLWPRSWKRFWQRGQPHPGNENGNLVRKRGWIAELVRG